MYVRLMAVGVSGLTETLSGVVCGVHEGGMLVSCWRLNIVTEDNVM